MKIRKRYMWTSVEHITDNAWLGFFMDAYDVGCHLSGMWKSYAYDVPYAYPQIRTLRNKNKL